MNELSEMTVNELNRERDILAMLYDDEETSIYEGCNERYGESDLKYWDQRVRAIDAELARLEILWERDA